MRSNRPVIILSLLIIATAGLAIVRRSQSPNSEQETGLIPRSAATELLETPHDRRNAILEEYAEADRRVAQAIQAAPPERKEIELRRRQEVRRTFAARFLALAHACVGDPSASDTTIDALTWVIRQCPDDPQGRQAVEQLLQGPITSERLANACQQLDASESPIAEPLFRAVLRRNPHTSARAQATVALARALRRRSERVGPGQSDMAQAADLAREAESLYVAAIANHGRMRLGRETLDKIAEAELFDLRHLGIGHEAPEINGPDLEGRPMALSDFRGKVVVLEFWGQWCSVSQETASHERSLAESVRGKPVILLGVNSDSPEMAAADGHRRICERSWRDGGEVNGGPIAHRWNVRALPTTYIIDHRGIIRYKIGPRPDGHDVVLEILDPTGKARDKWQLRIEEIAAVVNGLIAEIDRRPDPVPAPSSKSGTP